MKKYTVGEIEDLMTDAFEECFGATYEWDHIEPDNGVYARLSMDAEGNVSEPDENLSVQFEIERTWSDFGVGEDKLDELLDIALEESENPDYECPYLKHLYYMSWDSDCFQGVFREMTDEVNAYLEREGYLNHVRCKPDRTTSIGKALAAHSLSEWEEYADSDAWESALAEMNRDIAEFDFTQKYDFMQKYLDLAPNDLVWGYYEPKFYSFEDVSIALWPPESNMEEHKSQYDLRFKESEGEYYIVYKLHLNRDLELVSTVDAECKGCVWSGQISMSLTELHMQEYNSGKWCCVSPVYLLHRIGKDSLPYQLLVDKAWETINKAIRTLD